MRCYYCDHEIKNENFASKARQECKECHTVYQITFPSGVGFIPIVLAFLVALFVYTTYSLSLLVSLSVFVIVYWSVDIIMNNILIYLGKYEITEVRE